jgi:hypothetical protein
LSSNGAGFFAEKASFCDLLQPIFRYVAGLSVSPVCRLIIAWAAGDAWGDRGGFALAALTMSAPSFFLKRLFVFNVKHRTLGNCNK